MKLTGALVILGATLLLLTSGGGGYYCGGVRDASSPGSRILYPLGYTDAGLSSEDHLVFVFQIVAFVQL
jgi:hypothetical protein